MATKAMATTLAAVTVVVVFPPEAEALLGSHPAGFKNPKAWVHTRLRGWGGDGQNPGFKINPPKYRVLPPNASRV